MQNATCFLAFCFAEERIVASVQNVNNAQQRFFFGNTTMFAAGNEDKVLRISWLRNKIALDFQTSVSQNFFAPLPPFHSRHIVVTPEAW